MPQFVANLNAVFDSLDKIYEKIYCEPSTFFIRFHLLVGNENLVRIQGKVPLFAVRTEQEDDPGGEGAQPDDHGISEAKYDAGSGTLTLQGNYGKLDPFR